MVASSVVSTILILNYHHRNADTHEMSDWVNNIQNLTQKKKTLKKHFGLIYKQKKKAKQQKFTQFLLFIILILNNFRLYIVLTHLLYTHTLTHTLSLTLDDIFINPIYIIIIVMY